MGKSRVEYENLIRNSILFSLDRNTQATAYKREALKLVEYLYLYLVSINADKYTEFGLEITETANRCIKKLEKRCCLIIFGNSNMTLATSKMLRA